MKKFWKDKRGRLTISAAAIAMSLVVTSGSWTGWAAGQGDSVEVSSMTAEEIAAQEAEKLLDLETGTETQQPPAEETEDPITEDPGTEDGETPPEDGETPPEDGETPPEDGETPPEDGETPPEDGETPPEDEQTPTEEEQTPPGKDTPKPAETTPAATKPVVNKTDKELEEKVPVQESNPEWVSDSLPGWAESGQEYITGNLAVAEQIRLLEGELTKRIDEAKITYAVNEDAAITYEDENILDIFAVYAIKNDMMDNFPQSISFTDDSSRDEFLAIFNAMTRVSYVDEDHLVVKRLSYQDVAERYNISAIDQERLNVLVTEETKATLLEQYSTSILSTLTDEEFAWVESMIPEDISGARRSVLLAGLSLNGKISYFWGGKSYHVGWDQRWGELRTVTSAGVPQTGTSQTFGLDCSGFVTWSFINGGGDQSVLSYIGNGTAGQWGNSKQIEWDEVLPGDLVFYQTPNAAGINHIGIVVSNDEDGIKVVHCSGNGVAVTDASGFQYAKRPYIYAD